MRLIALNPGLGEAVDLPRHVQGVAFKGGKPCSVAGPPHVQTVYLMREEVVLLVISPPILLAVKLLIGRFAHVLCPCVVTQQGDQREKGMDLGVWERVHVRSE